MIAISTRTLPPRGSVAEICTDAAKLHFSELSIAAHDVAPRPGAFAEIATQTGVRIVNIKNGCLEARTGPRRVVEDLASLDEARRERAVRSTADHVAFAKLLQCRTVVLAGAFAEAPGIDERVRHLEGLVDRGETGGEMLEEIVILTKRNRDRHLERYCRSLHAITRSNPEIHFAMMPAARPHELLNTSAIADVFTDVKSSNLHLWFDTGRARAGERLGAEPAVLLLSSFANRIAGFDFHDARGIREHLVPGEGEVDWRVVREHVSRPALRVLDLEAGLGAAMIQNAARILDSMLPA